MNNLKSLRNEKKLTVRELAEQVNINYATLSRMENEKQSLDDKSIHELTKFFDVTADYLLGLSPHKNFGTIHIDVENEEEYDPNAPIEIIYSDNDNMSDEEIKEVLNLAEKIFSLPPDKVDLIQKLVDDFEKLQKKDS